MLKTWCKARGQTLLDYEDYLLDGKPVDGLEILLASLALDLPINVVIEDCVWGTLHSGPDFEYPTIVLTSVGGVPCKVIDPIEGSFGDVDTSVTTSTSDASQEKVVIPLTLLEQPTGGRPLVKEPERCSEHDSLSQMNTDLDDLLVEDNTGNVALPAPSGKASPQKCQICHMGVLSCSKLVDHLKLFHPSTKTYCCDQYESAFNNASALMWHHSSIHSVKKIRCHECDYRAVSRSCIKLHVQKHTRGL